MSEEALDPMTAAIHGELDEEDAINTAEIALNTPLAVKLRGRDEKPAAKSARKLNHAIEEQKHHGHDATIPDDPGESEMAREKLDEIEVDVPYSPIRARKRVRFLLEVAPEITLIHTTSKMLPASLKRQPPPPPPIIPPGFFENAPITKAPKDLPPIPNRPGPPLPPAEHFSSVSVTPPLPPKAPFSPFPLPATESHSDIDPREPIFTEAEDGDTYVNRTAFKLYSKFINEITEFVNFQNSVTRKRVQAQERRIFLNSQRSYILQRDDHLVEQLRVAIANDELNEDDLAQWFEDCQKARDDIVPLENHYEALEVELGAEEYSLKERLGKLQYRYENFFRLHGTSISTAPNPSTWSFESDSVPSEGAESAATGRRNGKRENRVAEGIPVGQPLPTLARKDDIIAVEASLPRPSRTPKMKLSNGSVESLSFSPERGSPDTQQDRTQGSTIYAELREQLAPASLVGIGDGPLEQDSMGTWESMVGTADPSLSYEHPNDVLEEFVLDTMLIDGDSLLLRGSDGETQSTLSDYLLDFRSTEDRVNKWLLHKLRVSPREVFNLQRQIQGAGPDVPDWANVVLKSWHSVGLGFERPYAGSETATHPGEKIVAHPEPYPPPLSASRTTRSSKSRMRRRRKSPSLHIEPSSLPTIDFLRKDITSMGGTLEITSQSHMLPPVA